jgi:hypothetical protein
VVAQVFAAAVKLDQASHDALEELVYRTEGLGSEIGWKGCGT